MDLKLFTTAFLQVFFVTANTYFISKTFYPGIIIASFGISWLWAGNVKKIAIGNKRDRFIYSIGAMCGGLLGVVVSKTILDLI
jgi:hypothetical protein